MIRNLLVLSALLEVLCRSLLTIFGESIYAIADSLDNKTQSVQNNYLVILKFEFISFLDQNKFTLQCDFSST